MELETLRFKNFEILKLKAWALKLEIFERFETWNFEKLKLGILKICAWNFDHEIWGLIFLGIENVEFFNLEMKILNWKFGI